MKVKYKRIKVEVDVSERDCLIKSCYWPRPDPGSFTQGQGYRTRLNAKGGIDWLCGNREIHGCPARVKGEV